MKFILVILFVFAGFVAGFSMCLEIFREYKDAPTRLCDNLCKADRKICREYFGL